MIFTYIHNKTYGMAYKTIIHDLKLLKFIFLNNHLKIVGGENKDTKCPCNYLPL